MDKREARTIAEKELQNYRSMSYSEIESRVGEVETFERISSQNEHYRVAVEFFLDDAEERNIRVSVAISYSLGSDFSPVCDDFILAPDGTFVGE